MLLPPVPFPRADAVELGMTRAPIVPVLQAEDDIRWVEGRLGSLLASGWTVQQCSSSGGGSGSSSHGTEAPAVISEWLTCQGQAAGVACVLGPCAGVQAVRHQQHTQV